MNFSIVIPAKNEELNIANCLRSLERLDYDRKLFEVIVVDNGSMDRTVEIARRLGASVHLKPNLTISGLRNFGALAASGKVIAFLDADCTVDRSWLCAAARYLAMEEVAAFGNPAVIPENATWVQRAWFEVRKKTRQVEEVAWHESANVFVRRECFLRVGGFNEELITCEDFDLSFRLRRHGTLLCDSRIIAVHHREPATVAEFFRKEKWRGKSNYRGVSSHGLQIRELPSLVIPPAYCLMALAVLFWIGLIPFGTNDRALAAVALAWQLPLLILAAWKARRSPTLAAVSQLYLLFNVYFLARGLATVGGARS